MRISRLELTNFRTFGHIVFENIPDLVLLVSPNGRGKSSILEAIAGIHDLVIPYHADTYSFKEIWQQRHVPFWPRHLATPLKIGQARAEVSIEIEATGLEIDFLKKVDIQQFTGKAKFVIEDGRRVTHETADTTIKRLFQYHSPAEGIGFLDYIRPVRFYLQENVGDFNSKMSDAITRKAFSEFHQPYNQHQKFSSFKSFVVSSQLNDFSHMQQAGERRDSLAIFKEIFDHFFAPKVFAGYRSPVGGGEAQIVVESPFGNHDTDSLSDGEKEILHVFAHLYRFRELSNIVLWDTPESHLNAALESRLNFAIRKVAPNNQFWIATHSLEFINAVPLENIFVLRQDGDVTRIERASGEDRKTRVAIYQEMGAQVGLQLVSSIVAFVEGKEAQSDKRILDRLVAPQIPGANFIAGGSCENVLAAGTRANHLLQEACANGDFMAIVDRDYRTDFELETIDSEYSGRVFVWRCHEIENLFLDSSVLCKTLAYLDKMRPKDDEESLDELIKQAAIEMRDWIAADWSAWELNRIFQPPSRRISGDDPKDSLLKYATRLHAKVTALASHSQIEVMLASKKAEVDQLLASAEWKARLPGKQILGRFLANYGAPALNNFIPAAVSTVINSSIQIPELTRVAETLRQRMALGR